MKNNSSYLKLVVTNSLSLSLAEDLKCLYAVFMYAKQIFQFFFLFLIQFLFHFFSSLITRYYFIHFVYITNKLHGSNLYFNSFSFIISVFFLLNPLYVKKKEKEVNQQKYFPIFFLPSYTLKSSLVAFNCWSLLKIAEM